MSTRPLILLVLPPHLFIFFPIDWGRFLTYASTFYIIAAKPVAIPFSEHHQSIHPDTLLDTRE